MIFIVAQIFGVLGMLFGFISYQNNSHKRIMIMKSLSEGLFAIHYFLLNSYTGLAMNCIGITRNIVFTYLVLKKKSTIPYIVFFSVVMAVVGSFTWIGWISIFAIFGKICTTVAYGIKDPKWVRFVSVPSCCSWLIYNTYCHSIAGILTEAFGLASIIIASIRFKKNNQK